MIDEELKQLVQSNALTIQARGQRIDSNSRAIQVMIEQRATDRLKHEQRIARLEDLVLRLNRIDQALEFLIISYKADSEPLPEPSVAAA